MIVRPLASGLAALLVCACATPDSASTATLGLRACVDDATPVAAFAGTAATDAGINPVEVWGLRADGSVMRLTEGKERSLNPALFPSGGQLLFARGPDDEYAGGPSPATEIWTVELADQTGRPLLAHRDVGQPAVSPDEKSYVFPGQVGDPSIGTRRILIASVTQAAGQVLAAEDPPSPYIEEHPTWRPDGSSVTYTFASQDDAGNVFYEIRDTARDTRKTATIFRADRNVLIGSVAWSPDGKRLLFTQNRLVSAERSSTTAWELSAASLEAREVASNVVFELAYSSADGSTFSGVGMRDDDNPSALWTWSIEGGDPAEQTLAFDGASVDASGPLSIATCALGVGGT